MIEIRCIIRTPISHHQWFIKYLEYGYYLQYKKCATKFLMLGIVTYLILCHILAPSIMAASYSSRFIPCSEAKYISAVAPAPFQVIETTISGIVKFRITKPYHWIHTKLDQALYLEPLYHQVYK